MNETNTDTAANQLVQSGDKEISGIESTMSSENAGGMASTKDEPKNNASSCAKDDGEMTSSQSDTRIETTSTITNADGDKHYVTSDKDDCSKLNSTDEDECSNEELSDQQEDPDNPDGPRSFFKKVNSKFKKSKFKKSKKKECATLFTEEGETKHNACQDRSYEVRTGGDVVRTGGDVVRTGGESSFGTVEREVYPTGRKSVPTVSSSIISPTPSKLEPTTENNHPRAPIHRSVQKLLKPPIVDPDVYDFSHSQRGYMVIIVNETFLNESKRDGAVFDVIKAKSIAIKLGFQIFNQNKCRNLRKPETMAILLEAQQMDHSNFDCFAFMFSSHGLEANNQRLRGKLDHALICSDDQMIFTSTILEMFSDKNCPSLKGKPKMFFIQACRGTDVDDGGDIYVRGPIKDRASPLFLERNTGNSRSNVDSGQQQTDGSLKEPTDMSDTKHSGDSWASGTGRGQCYISTAHAQLQVPGTQPGVDDIRFMDDNTIQHRTSIPESQCSRTSGASESYPWPVHQYTVKPYPINNVPMIQCDADFLVMYAIPPGMFAWRNKWGSWMIDYLDQAIKAYDMRRPKSFLFLLTQVSNKMSERETNVTSDRSIHDKKAISVVEYTLTKDIMFQTKVFMWGNSADKLEY